MLSIDSTRSHRCTWFLIFKSSWVYNYKYCLTDDLMFQRPHLSFFTCVRALRWRRGFLFVLLLILSFFSSFSLFCVSLLHFLLHLSLPPPISCMRWREALSLSNTSIFHTCVCACVEESLPSLPLSFRLALSRGWEDENERKSIFFPTPSLFRNFYTSSSFELFAIEGEGREMREEREERGEERETNKFLVLSARSLTELEQVDMHCLRREKWNQLSKFIKIKSMISDDLDGFRGWNFLTISSSMNLLGLV